MRTLLIVCVLFFPESCLTSAPNCSNNTYPQAKNFSVPTVVVNLDLPPEERWTQLVSLKRQEILQLRDALIDLVGGFMDGRILQLVDKYGPKLADTLPSPFKEELQGLSNLTGINLGEVVLYNVFYEFFTLCTSVVAQTQDGEIIHGRNLDFGLFLGWNKTSHTWSMTERLRSTVVQIEWQQAGKTIYHSVNFAGYIGVLTGVRPGAFSFSINERFNLNGGFIGILQWIIHQDRSLQWVGFLGREILENEVHFEDAKKVLIQAKLLAPVYFIIGGTKLGEGIVITKDRNSNTADVLSMSENKEIYGGWYILQTNYDHWKKVPFFDDRRTPGNICMGRVGAKRISLPTMFDVLSTQPNLNKLTAYTALMNVNSGIMETYLQRCSGDCSPW